MGRRRPVIRDRNLEIGLGVLLFAAGSYLLYDAWEGRGARTPLLARPFLPW